MPWIYNSNLVHNGQNYTYDVFQQNTTQNCVPSSLVMMIKYVPKVNWALGIAQARLRQIQQLIQQNPRAVRAPQTLQRPNLFPGAGWHYGANAGGPQGASLAHAFCILKHYFPQQHWYWMHRVPWTGAMPIQLAHCTLQRPAMVNIVWNNGGAMHAAICLGKPPFRNEVIFLDPKYGVVASSYVVARNGSLIYDTLNNSLNGPARTGLISAAIFT